MRLRTLRGTNTITATSIDAREGHGAGRIMRFGSTNLAIIILVVATLAGSLRAAAQSGTLYVGGTMLDPQGQPAATSDKTNPLQLSGTVVDASGAVISGAVVQVRSANGTVQRTRHSDRNGSFIISGLAAGNYRLVV